jgi:hypothetical protein
VKQDKYLIIFAFLTFILLSPRAFPESFEVKKPRDEKAVLVPKGARPVVKEEYPRHQLVIDRIKARHGHILIIPFARSWNTAAFTASTGVEEEAGVPPEDFELGFALHSQRLKVGALSNREYFQRETEGFPEGWYRPLHSTEFIDQPQGYMSTTFVHLSAKRIRRKYSDYRDFTDRINGILNVIMQNKQQLTLMARRDMQSFRTEGIVALPRIRNAASIYYKRPGEDENKLEVKGESTWSSLTDFDRRDFRYISGTGTFGLTRALRPDVDADIKTILRISHLRDHDNDDTLYTRKYGWLRLSNIVSPAEFAKLRLDVSALYDSEYKGYFTPGVELGIVPRIVQLKAGFRKRVILPEYDELYWQSKFVKVNNDLEPVDFWEVYGSFEIDLIARLALQIEASYSRPESRITWNQVSEYVWEPINIDTTEAFTGQASIILDLIGSFGTFAGLQYQYFDNQLFDPEIIANGGFFYGRSSSGSLTLGASFWKFQTVDIQEAPEDYLMGYLRISKSVRRVINIFIEGRYTVNGDNVLYYQGMPQAGRIVSAGVNVVFGGLD